jgi:hypothetical protein
MICLIKILYTVMNFVIFHCPETYNLLRVASITVQNFSPCDCEKPLKG